MNWRELLKKIFCLYSNLRLYRAEKAKLLKKEKLTSATLRSICDGVITCDTLGKVVSLNTRAEALTGWSENEAMEKPISEVFSIVHSETLEAVNIPIGSALCKDCTIGPANQTSLISRNGTLRQIADSCSPIHDRKGALIGSVLVFRDVSEEYISRRLTRTRLALIEYAHNHTLDELMTRALDEISKYSGSLIGFFHFVDKDQENLCLQQWSTQTLKDFCKAKGKGTHYPIAEAGVWAD